MTFSLTGNIAASPAMLETRHVTYAAMSIPTANCGSDLIPLAVGMCLLGIAMSCTGPGNRRRILIAIGAVILLSATSIGCGGDNSNSAPAQNTAPPPTTFSSTQSVTGISSSPAFTFIGLPISLGSVIAK
jgi:hypothetical protein